mmetsp:Transcript_15484/g.35231  ORF Transcript_15484/g.35231 Transcript_15484/m.35231 type:complete len:247 (+) Transcript_15484:86-826(+)
MLRADWRLPECKLELCNWPGVQHERPNRPTHGRGPRRKGHASVSCRDPAAGEGIQVPRQRTLLVWSCSNLRHSAPFRHTAASVLQLPAAGASAILGHAGRILDGRPGGWAGDWDVCPDVLPNRCDEGQNIPSEQHRRLSIRSAAGGGLHFRVAVLGLAHAAAAAFAGLLMLVQLLENSAGRRFLGRGMYSRHLLHVHGSGRCLPPGSHCGGGAPPAAPRLRELRSGHPLEGPRAPCQRLLREEDMA